MYIYCINVSVMITTDMFSGTSAQTGLLLTHLQLHASMCMCVYWETTELVCISKHSVLYGIICVSIFMKTFLGLNLSCAMQML